MATTPRTRPPTQPDIEAVRQRRLEVARLRKAGTEVAEMATRFGVSQTTIGSDMRWLRKQGYDLGDADRRKAANRRAQQKRLPGYGGVLDTKIRCLELRRAGMSPHQISEELRLSTGTVAKHISEAMAEIVQHNVSEMRELENQRLDVALQAAMKLLMHSNPDVRLKAVGRVVQTVQERCKVNGLYVPVKIEALIHEADKQDVELAEMIAEAQAAIARQEAELRAQSNGHNVH